MKRLFDTLGLYVLAALILPVMGVLWLREKFWPSPEETEPNEFLQGK